MYRIPLNAPMKGVAIADASGLVYVKPYGGSPVGHATVKPSTAVKKRPAPRRMLVFLGPPVSFGKKRFFYAREYATPKRGENYRPASARSRKGFSNHPVKEVV